MSDQKRIDSIISKCNKFGFCTKPGTFCELLLNCDRKFFSKIQNSSHCLNFLLPDLRTTAGILRARGHPYVLPTCRRELYKKSFLTRSLFSFV